MKFLKRTTAVDSRKNSPKEGRNSKKAHLEDQESEKNERASIFAKLIASHIFISAIPVLVVALIILNLAQKGILDEVKTSNIGLTQKNSDCGYEI